MSSTEEACVSLARASTVPSEGVLRAAEAPRRGGCVASLAAGVPASDRSPAVLRTKVPGGFPLIRQGLGQMGSTCG